MVLISRDVPNDLESVRDNYENFKCGIIIYGIGAGTIITYNYGGQKVADSMVEFSTWNDEGIALSESHDALADEILNCRQNNNVKHIEFKTLFSDAIRIY